MSAPVQLAIEIKHGGKGWTLRQLEAALKQQLAVNYLKPSTRRHGILVVTHHRDRKWVDPKSRKPMTFENLIERLSSIAATLDHNAFGAIGVKCVGIGLLPRWRPKKCQRAVSHAVGADRCPHEKHTNAQADRNVSVFAARFVQVFNGFPVNFYNSESAPASKMQPILGMLFLGACRLIEDAQRYGVREFTIADQELIMGLYTSTS
jgi:hypothetical protein